MFTFSLSLSPPFSHSLSLSIFLSFFHRAQAHAAAALINFCEDSRVEELAPFINDLLSALFTRLRDGSRMVQEQVCVCFESKPYCQLSHCCASFFTITPLHSNSHTHSHTGDHRDRHGGRLVQGALYRLLRPLCAAAEADHCAGGGQGGPLLPRPRDGVSDAHWHFRYAHIFRQSSPVNKSRVSQKHA